MPNRSAMFSSTFIFSKKQFDDEFHRLDEAISQAARSTPGYLGEESWESSANGLISNVYYWESLEALQLLMKHPKHLEAKSKQAKWLAGYQVVISQVLRMYGDTRLNGLLPVNPESRPEP
jgi:heme-degrading monooxygenase HmoA